jgi:membrane protein
MATPTRPDDPPAADRLSGHSFRDRARRRLAAARARFNGTWAEAFIAQLRTVDAVSWTTIFGAELLWSVLPLLILLSSLASTRIDDDLSRHIGLNHHGAHIVEGLFRGSPSHDALAILTGLIFSFAGTIAVVTSIEKLYERAFAEERLRRRDVPRRVAWVFVLLLVLILQAIIQKPVRTAVGPVVQTGVRFVIATLFFWWTMHFLLAGRAPWRVLLRPAIVTALLWIGLAIFSSLYFSSVLVSDSHEYGTIGVVFTLLTWFILVGGVFVLGAACGAVWHQRSQPPSPGAGQHGGSS